MRAGQIKKASTKSTSNSPRKIFSKPLSINLPPYKNAHDAADAADEKRPAEATDQVAEPPADPAADTYSQKDQ